ncbi:DUF6417 family protein, partial [Streptomyces mirabilis]
MATPSLSTSRIKRWRLYLTPDQIASVAYGLWLHRMTGSAAEANRFGREYGVVHDPTQASAPSVDAAGGPAGPSRRRALLGVGAGVAGLGFG